MNTPQTCNEHINKGCWSWIQLFSNRDRAIAKLLKIADVLERDGRTIWEWQKALSCKCKSFHLALRQKVSYLQRKTLGYCKNQKNFQQILWINLFDYNYRQPHKSLRQDLTGESQKFKRRYQHLTPAMKMGLTSTQLQWQDLIVAPIAENSHEFSTSTVL